MKNLRYVLVGFVFGGAFGAKIGAYLCNLFEVPAPANLVEAGFLYGAAVGSIAAVTFVAAYALANIHNRTSEDYRSERMISST